MRQPSSLLYGTRLAQQYGRSKDCQRSCSVLHDGALHAPFPTNTPLAPRLLCLYLFLSFRAMALGQVHLQGVWIEMHWSLAHWKQAYSPCFFFFFLCIQWTIKFELSLLKHAWVFKNYSGSSMNLYAFKKCVFNWSGRNCSSLIHSVAIHFFKAIKTLAWEIKSFF